MYVSMNMCMCECIQVYECACVYLCKYVHTYASMHRAMIPEDSALVIHLPISDEF